MMVVGWRDVKYHKKFEHFHHDQLVLRWSGTSHDPTRLITKKIYDKTWEMYEIKGFEYLFNHLTN